MLKKRNIGRTHDMALSIKDNLLLNKTVAVIGCTDPKPILNRLENIGIIAKSKAILSTESMKPEYAIDGNEEYIKDWKTGNEQLSGFLFYL